MTEVSNSFEVALFTTKNIDYFSSISVTMFQHFPANGNAKEVIIGSLNKNHLKGKNKNCSFSFNCTCMRFMSWAGSNKMKKTFK